MFLVSTENLTKNLITFFFGFEYYIFRIIYIIVNLILYLKIWVNIINAYWSRCYIFVVLAIVFIKINS